MNISDEAVEILARRDYDANAAQSDYEFPLWEDAVKDPAWALSVQDFRDDARKTLEQIAPHLMAEAWEEGRIDGHAEEQSGYENAMNPYRAAGAGE